MRSQQDKREGGMGKENVSVQDAAVVLCEDVGGALYFLHVPDQRRKRDRKSGRRLSNVASYGAVAHALKERGVLMTNAQDLKAVWSKFQSARTTHTTFLRDELLKTIEWKKASSLRELPTDSIGGLVARLRWPSVQSASREQGCLGSEEDSLEVSPEKITKRRKKCDSVQSPFRLHALRSRREVLNGAIFGLQSSAGLELESRSFARRDPSLSSPTHPGLLSLDTDSDLTTGDMNGEVLLAVHIAANASKEIDSWMSDDEVYCSGPSAVETRILQTPESAVKTLVAVETLLGVEGENAVTRLQQCIKQTEMLESCVRSLSAKRFRCVQEAALKAAGYLDPLGERVVQTVKEKECLDEGNSSTLLEKARLLGFC